jgi:2-dehydro-3-deoxyphosphogluconate aldolase/(4S)-4-hydroxy-2-oxoglutarate aldolase
MEALAVLRRLRIVPVIVIDDPAAAPPLAEALEAGGLPCAEVTFRTAAAADALGRMTRAAPAVFVGAGTVLDPGQVDIAKDAGARFIVAPGLNRRVVERAQQLGLPVFPGVCTPSEIETARELGLRILKFFPAEPIGGLPYLKAIAAPYIDVQFIPTGGINADNLTTWLAFGRVIACGGSWMVAQEWIRAGDFDRIRTEVEKAVRIAGLPGGN